MAHHKHKKFWNKEYEKSGHLQLSDKPAQDLVKFTRWADRNFPEEIFRPDNVVLDVGCGNGRNLIHLAKEFYVRGYGYDIAAEAINQATENAKGLDLQFTVQALDELIDLPDESVDVVLDMMASHYLDEVGREQLRSEILRVLKPGGWLFFKSFLKDGDVHAAKLLKQHGTEQHNTYIHPRIGVPEYVWSEKAFREFYESHFTAHKILRSHRHIVKGKPHKRRTIVSYLQKPLAEE